MAATVPQAALALRNILIATDFSACSERALLHAVAVAHHFGSTLHMLHAVKPAMFAMMPPDAYMGTTEAESIALEKARNDAKKLIADVLDRTNCEDLQCRTWVSLGEVGEIVKAVSRHEHIDMIVVGTHGKTGLRRLVMGSAAEEIFRHATCPVLTVGPHSWRSDPQSVRLRHILFPTDLSAESASALPFATATACEFGAALTVMHLLEPLRGEAASDSRRVIGAIEQRMEEMVSVCAMKPAKVDYQVKLGDVADSVIEAASRLEVDLVAFGLKAPDTYTDRLPWMHAYKVVCEVACPVLSMRNGWRRE